MHDLSRFRTIAPWKEALGLLPVPLRASAENRERFVLLNGSTGNFCLDFESEVSPELQRALAWSCDVGHYITCIGDSVSVTRWDRDGSEEKFSSKSVGTRLHEFHRYLEKSSPDRSRGIITHVLGVFRRIRSVLNDQVDGLDSLRVLLHLIASAAAGVEQLSESDDLALWGISHENLEASRRLALATWQPLHNDLAGVGRYDVLRPDFELVIRHASGAVFQDAHLEANNSPTFWLPGFELPSTVSSQVSPVETGIYFTPPALARTLAEEATFSFSQVAGRQLTIFDPACGSGELLKEALRLLKIRGYSGSAQVIGWDKSKAAVDMATFVLSWEKRGWLPNQIDVQISQHDSIVDKGWPTNVDILVMNPPFKSWQLMTSVEQTQVAEIVETSGKPNLAMAFARRGLSVLGNDGVLAMISPNSLLEGTSISARETREAMAEALDPQLVARLGDQSIFSRALVDAGMYVGKKKSSGVLPTGVVWADSRVNSLNQALRSLRKWRGAEAQPIKGDGYAVYKRSDVGSSGNPWVARSYDSWFLYKKFQNSATMAMASQLFDIKQGVRLGNDVFVVSKEYVQSLRKAERRFFRAAVMNPSIVDGKLTDQYYAFYRYTEGLPAIDTEEHLKEHVPQYYREHLLQTKAALQSRKTLVRQTELKWWDLLWPRTWQMKPTPKIVSKYFGGRRSFAFDSTGEYVVVVGNGWLLRKGTTWEGTAELQDSGLYQPTEKECYLAVLAYLSSTLSHELLEYLSVQVSGGQLDLSNKYISDLPIPNLNLISESDLTRLIEIGNRVVAGNIHNWSEVDETVLSIFAG